MVPRSTRRTFPCAMTLAAPSMSRGIPSERAKLLAVPSGNTPRAVPVSARCSTAASSDSVSSADDNQRHARRSSTLDRRGKELGIRHALDGRQPHTLATPQRTLGSFQLSPPLADCVFTISAAFLGGAARVGGSRCVIAKRTMRWKRKSSRRLFGDESASMGFPATWTISTSTASSSPSANPTPGRLTNCDKALGR